MGWRASGCSTRPRSANWDGCAIDRAPNGGRRGRTVPGARAESEAVLLVAGAAGLVWRCRLELAIVAVLALAFVLLASVLGEPAAGVLVAGTATTVSVVPRSRGLLLRWLRAAAIRR